MHQRNEIMKDPIEHAAVAAFSCFGKPNKYPRQSIGLCAGPVVTLDPNPKGKFKRLGASLADDWNMRLLNLVARALPIDQSNSEENNKASTAVWEAMIDIALTDPIEGILSQLMTANEAALAVYRKGWAQPPEYFQACTKYLQLADKATRTVLMLTESLDQHRGRGQQQIVVKHVTVNADQALVTDSVVTGTAAGHAALLPPAQESMAVLEAAQPVLVGEVSIEMTINPMQSAHDAPRCNYRHVRAQRGDHT
jgi:hypothetical protein